MHEMAEQGTFGGRFGGRKSLQSRKSGTFGGTFVGRKSQTDPKVFFQGQASAAECCLHKGVRRPKVPSAAEPELLPNGRNSALLCTFRLPSSNHAYHSTKTCIQAPRGLKQTYTPTTTLQTYSNMPHCSQIT